MDRDHNHPLIGFLNINSIRNEIIDLRMLMEKCLPDNSNNDNNDNDNNHNNQFVLSWLQF